MIIPGTTSMSVSIGNMMLGIALLKGGIMPDNTEHTLNFVSGVGFEDDINKFYFNSSCFVNTTKGNNTFLEFTKNYTQGSVNNLAALQVEMCETPSFKDEEGVLVFGKATLTWSDGKIKFANMEIEQYAPISISDLNKLHKPNSLGKISNNLKQFFELHGVAVSK